MLSFLYDFSDELDFCSNSFIAVMVEVMCFLLQSAGYTVYFSSLDYPINQSLLLIIYT